MLALPCSWGGHGLSEEVTSSLNGEVRRITWHWNLHESFSRA
jgi:hypothetical protein